MEIEDGVIRQGRKPRRITPSEIAIILQMIRKPNSIIVLLFIQNSNSTDNDNDDDDNVRLIMTMIYRVALGVCVFWSYEI